MKTTQRGALLATLGLVLAASLALGCSYEDRPPYNACDWPNHCDGLVLQQVSEIGTWAKEDLQAGRLSAGIYDRILRGVTRSRDPDLRNRQNDHVCVLKNPEPCAELADVHAAARAAKEAPEGNAKASWETCANLMDRFPSGS